MVTRRRKCKGRVEQEMINGDENGKKEKIQSKGKINPVMFVAVIIWSETSPESSQRS